MIVRMWHGRTRTADAPAYLAFLTERAIPDYRGTQGNLGVQILQQTDGEQTHFVTLTHWTSIDAIKAFAGEDYALAKYYPEDTGFLLEFEPLVEHYQLAAASGAWPPGTEAGG